MSKDINETTQLKESNEPQTRNNLNNKEEQNQSQQGNSSLYNDPQYRALLNHFGGKIPRLRPELQELKEQVLKYGTDIMDDEDEKKYADRPYFEKLGHKLSDDVVRCVGGNVGQDVRVVQFVAIVAQLERFS